MKARRGFRRGSILMTAFVIVTLLVVGCSEQETPFAVGDRATPTPTQQAGIDTPTPAPDAQDTSAAAILPGGGELYDEGYTTGPTRDALVLFGVWNDNRVKLTSWVAGYIVAHGLDHPVRMIEVGLDESQAAVVGADVDVLLEADAEWAMEQSELGNVLLLDSHSPGNPDTRIVVHPSMAERAPDVIAFLEGYVPDAALIEAEAARISSGRIGLKENVVGLSIIEDRQDVWSQWVEADIANNITMAVAEEKVSLCRKISTYAPTQTGSVSSSYCVDDPTKAFGNR